MAAFSARDAHRCQRAKSIAGMPKTHAFDFGKRLKPEPRLCAVQGFARFCKARHRPAVYSRDDTSIEEPVYWLLLLWSLSWGVTKG